MRLPIVLFIVLFIVVHTVSAEERPKTAAEMGIMQGSPPERTIDMSKWDKGPDNRWAFQHISEIIPTANISRGSGPIAELPRKLTDLSGFLFETPDDKKMTVKTMLETTYTDGFIVLHDGNVIYEKYFNGMTPTTRHLLMSVSKSVTGTLAGILVNDGRLNPDKKLVHYLPEIKASPGFVETRIPALSA